MSQNTLTANIIFYFKGEKFDFSAEIDLDEWLKKYSGGSEYVYDVIAITNGLDRYRHEYDVMVMESVQFSHATGLAASYLEDGDFDVEAYQIGYEQEKTLVALDAIAKQYLDIDKLEEHPKIKSALLAAYHAKDGKRDKRSEPLRMEGL